MGRGNFLFSLQAALFFEWVCRLCATDPGGNAIAKFEKSLKAIQPLYFVDLPAPCPIHPPVHFSNPKQSVLVLLIYDLIRNGVSHRYQQTVLHLSDGYFYIRLGGADYGRLFGQASHAGHLWLKQDQDGSQFLQVWPDIWFLDIEAAVEKADLLSDTNLRSPSWSADKKYGALSVSGLVAALRAGGIYSAR